MSEIHGLRIKELRDHQAPGNKVIGSFCRYVPEEIIRAPGAAIHGERLLAETRAAGRAVHGGQVEGQGSA